MIGNVRLTMLFAVLLAFVGACTFGNVISSNDVPRMTKEDLLSNLDNPEVVIIDVRSGKDWQASDSKIKGAVRESTKDTLWSEKYEKAKTLVLYCA